MRTTSRLLAFAAAAVFFLGTGVAHAAGSSSSSSSETGVTAQPRSTGTTYDRNPSVVQDGSRTYLFFARTKTPCDRLAGCDADNSDYDLYMKVSTNGGRTYGPDTLVALNPGPAAIFRGRTIAATRRADGKMIVFWASGANSSALYVLEETSQGVFSAPQPVLGVGYVPGIDGVFNVDAVAKGNNVFVYTEECCTSPGVYAQRYVSAATPVVGRTVVALNRNLPKATIDRNGTFRLTYTDASPYPTVEVYVDSSSDGLTFGNAHKAISEVGVSHWDPNLAQADGWYFLFSAPDDGSGRQQIAVAVSRDFVHWSQPVRITPASQQGVNYWDYWPEPFVTGKHVSLYYTSERGIGTQPPGTGHVWSLSAHD